MNTRHLVLALALTLSATTLAFSQRTFQSYGGAGPYASGVKVPPGKAVYYSSGVTSNAKDGATMREQALGAMKRLEANIAAAGSGLGDVVFVRAYLKPGANGAIDYAGWDHAWSEVFGAQKSPNPPARTTVGVPSPNANGSLVEIEYVSIAPDPAKMAASSAALSLPVTNPNLKPFGTRDARIYAGVGVMPGSGLYWTAGLTAPVLNSSAPASSYDNRGDMRTQARNTLARLKENIEAAGLTLADVVYVRAWLGPDVNMGGRFDVDGWNLAYAEFFNNPGQPHKPARVTTFTPTFASNAGGQPNSMIEIEFIAAYSNAPALFEGEGAGKPRREFGAPGAMFAAGVAAKPGMALYLSSGTLPGVDGDMKTQATSVLESLKAGLAQGGGSLSDVVFLRAYLVPAPDGSVDRDGWNQAYSSFFNNPAQPNKPGRVTIPVTSLPKEGAKIAIDVIASLP
jgi:enamine deaminase RidA (YjgF/YER057c/UK114 family)